MTAVIIPTVIVLVVSLWLIGDVLKFIITSNGDRLSLISLIIVIKLHQYFFHREPSPFSSSISHCLHLCIVFLHLFAFINNLLLLCTVLLRLPARSVTAVNTLPSTRACGSSCTIVRERPRLLLRKFNSKHRGQRS